jgi:uncharacterized protein with PIN domain
MQHLKFVADVMVGKLAHWLRMLGFDVLYCNRYDDEEIVDIARAENRVILTRDVALATRHPVPDSLLIQSDDFEKQIREVLRTFDLKEFRLFSRCAECNAPLEAVNKESVFNRIPPYVYLTQSEFALCPSCNRVYWHGSHSEGIRNRIARLL